MRLVVDTNVLVSAFLWQGTPGRLVELASSLSGFPLNPPTTRACRAHLIVIS